MSAIDILRERVASELDASRRVEMLILGLAEAIKATSNDQNVQRLSRELRASAAALAVAMSPAPV